MGLTAILIQQRRIGEMKKLLNWTLSTGPSTQHCGRRTVRTVNPGAHSLSVKQVTCTPSHFSHLPTHPPLSRIRRSVTQRNRVWEWEKVGVGGSRESQYKLCKWPNHWVDRGLPFSQVSEEKRQSKVLFNNWPLSQWSKASDIWLTFQLQVYTCIRMLNRFLCVS